MRLRGLCVVLAGLALACSDGPTLVRGPDVSSARLVIRDVNVVDVVVGQLLEGRDLIIEDGRIRAVLAGGSAEPASSDVVIDGAGATVLPGLIDSHSHLDADRTPIWDMERGDPERTMRQYLYAGVTTVLEAAGPLESLTLRSRVSEGTLLGTRIFTAGPMLTAEGGHPAGLIRALVFWPLDEWVISSIAREVTSEADAEAHVEELSAAGADFVKVAVDRLPSDAPRLDTSTLGHIAKLANARDLRMIAHVGTVQDAVDAAQAGASIWMHGVYRERIPDGRIAELARFGIPMVPTTVVFDAYRTARQQRTASPMEKETIPAEILQAYNEPPETLETGGMEDVFEDIQALRGAWLENIKRLHDAGVEIFAGSDCQPGVFAGGGLHRELDLLHEAGLSPMEVIRGATLLPARFLQKTDSPDFGRIAEGARADLLIVDGNPLEDWGAIHRIRDVIRDGVRLDRLPVGQER